MAIEESVVKGDGTLLAGAEAGGLGMPLLVAGEVVEAIEKEGPALEGWVRRE